MNSDIIPCVGVFILTVTLFDLMFKLYTNGHTCAFDVSYVYHYTSLLGLGLVSVYQIQSCEFILFTATFCSILNTVFAICMKFANDQLTSLDKYKQRDCINSTIRYSRLNMI